MRRCLTCNGFIPRGQRCSTCGTRQARGYGREWELLSRSVVASHPYCSSCGHRGSRDNPLTCDHVVPKAAGGTDDPTNLCVLCRECNSAKGSRLI